MSGEDRPRGDGARKRQGLVLAVLSALLLVTASLGYWFTRDLHAPAEAPAPEPMGAVEGLPDVSTPKAIDVPEAPPLPSVVVDVLQPKPVVGALLDNAWLASQANAPLGRGFLGPWAAFFGSRGEQLKTAFSGTLASYFSTTFLSAPFRLVYFGGRDTPGSPVFIQDDPPTAATAAFDVLDAAAKRGTLTASRCPGGPEPEPAADGPGAPPLFAISRWLIADQVLYAARHGSRLVLGRDALAVILGVCVDRARLASKATPGADVEVSFRVAGLGREAQVLVGALGLREAPSLAFRIDRGRLVAHGIGGAVQVPGRLSIAAIPDALLTAIPAETPVVLGLVPVLPETLSLAALTTHFGQETPPAGALARQVVVLFTPRGAPGLPTEVGFLWSRPEDEADLARIFDGPNPLLHRSVCGQLAFASDPALLNRIEETCQKKRPSILAIGPSVGAGLKAPTSLLLSIRLGRLLSGLVEEAYREDTKARSGPTPSLPPELEAARRELEALPELGFLGRVQDEALVPGGFGS